MKRGMNSSEMQKKNRMLVFRTLLENGSMTRTALAAGVGLQKATITNIINEFLDLGIIGIDGDAAAGRRGENICLILDGIYIMSMDITRKDFQIGIFSLYGEQVKHIGYRFEKNEDLYSVFDKLKRNALELMNEFGKKKIIGVCMAVPGPFIRKIEDGSELFQVSEFEELNNINLRRELEETLGMPMVIKHDAKLSAYAEWRNAEEVKANEKVSLIIIRSRGYGIGAGIVINGKIVEGQLGIAGEVGHIGINYNGRRFENEHSGTFEYCAGTESAVRYMQERLFEFPDSMLNEKSTYQDIVEAYQRHDPLAVWAIEKMAWMLGYGIANIIYMINPDCIILGPDYPNDESFVEVVRRTVRQFVSPYVGKCVSIRYSRLEEDSFLLGGYYYILEKLCNGESIIEKIEQAKN